MTLHADPLRKLGARRSHVPAELKGAFIGTTDRSSLTLAYLVRQRLQRGQSTYGHLLCDVNGRCYLVMRDCESLSEVLREAPQIFVGRYDETAEVADIAADIESTHRGTAS